MMRKIFLSTVVFVLSTLTAAAWAKTEIPEPLQPWVGWVLKGREAQLCPFFQGGTGTLCRWASPLGLSGVGGPIPPGAARAEPAARHAESTTNETAATSFPTIERGHSIGPDPPNGGVAFHPFCGSVQNTDIPRSRCFAGSRK